MTGGSVIHDGFWEDLYDHDPLFCKCRTCKSLRRTPNKPDNVMKQFDKLLDDHDTFKSHLRSCLRTALNQSSQIIQPSMTRRERVGHFISCLRRSGISLANPGYRYAGRYSEDRWRRSFPGIPDKPGPGNPHELAKHLLKEIMITGNWVEPGVLRTNSCYTEGSVMETLTNKVMRDFENDNGDQPDFGSISRIIDSMKFCIDDSNKLVRSAQNETDRVAQDLAEIESGVSPAPASGGASEQARLLHKRA